MVDHAAGRIDDLPAGEGLGVIEDPFVEPEARSFSVGAAQANAVMACFEERGCSGPDALAPPGADASKRFFEKSGLTARLPLVDRRLTRDG